MNTRVCHQAFTSGPCHTVTSIMVFQRWRFGLGCLSLPASSQTADFYQVKWPKRRRPNNRMPVNVCICLMSPSENHHWNQSLSSDNFLLFPAYIWIDNNDSTRKSWTFLRLMLTKVVVYSKRGWKKKKIVWSIHSQQECRVCLLPPGSKTFLLCVVVQ